MYIYQIYFICKYIDIYIYNTYYKEMYWHNTIL